MNRTHRLVHVATGLLLTLGLATTTASLVRPDPSSTPWQRYIAGTPLREPNTTPWQRYAASRALPDPVGGNWEPRRA